MFNNFDKKIKSLEETISEYEEKGDFTHAYFEDKVIGEAEAILGIKIPNQYEWFLRAYGHGGIGGIETLGVGRNGSSVFVDKTLEFREYGLPIEMIVIENCDEWIYCLDVKNERVYMWAFSDKKCMPAYEDFIDYLNDRVKDAIENL